MVNHMHENRTPSIFAFTETRLKKTDSDDMLHTDRDKGCVPIQGQHPLECALEVQLRHYAA